MAPLFPREGGCRCGKVRFRLTENPLITAACHCRGCQRMSASAFSVTAIMPPTGLEIIAGETVIGGPRFLRVDTHTVDVGAAGRERLFEDPTRYRSALE